MLSFILICFACVCVALAMPLKANAAENSAVQSIIDVKNSIDTANEELFNASVDMESLVGQCVDIFLEDANNVDQKTLPTMLAIMLSAVSKSDAAREKLRSALVKEVSDYIRFGIRSGAYGGNMQSGMKAPSGLLSTVFSTTFMSRKEITHVGEAIPESGAIYVATLLKDHGTANEYPVEFWLREQGGHWRIVGIRNVRTLMRLFQGEEFVQS